jgi:hypothetical protein
VLVWAYRYRGLLPGRPDVLDDAGGPLCGVAGDAAQEAGLLACRACPHGGLALLPLALTQMLSHLAGQCVVFPPGACSSVLSGGFFAPQGGLAAFDGLPAPGHLGPRPGHRLAGACLRVRHRQAKRPRQVAQLGLALVGVLFPPVGQDVALVGVPFPPVGQDVALVGVLFPLISDLLALVSLPSGLPGQCVEFPPGACPVSLLPGVFAPRGGLAAFDGLPAPSHLGLGPGRDFPGACLPACHLQASRPCPLIGYGFALVGVSFPLIGYGFALVGVSFPLIGYGFALVGVPVTAVGPSVLRGTGTGPRVMRGGLHCSRMRLFRCPSRCLGLACPTGAALVRPGTG